MPNKVEGLFKRTFGVKPRDLEPKPTDLEMAHMIANRKNGNEAGGGAKT